MKSILISIKPKWVAKILNGEKTIEVRKNKALYKAIQTLISMYGYAEFYGYCTKDDDLGRIKDLPKDRYFVDCVETPIDFLKMDSGYNGKGKVLFKFCCYKVEEITPKMWTPKIEHEILENSCLKEHELFDYICSHDGTEDKPFYAICISELEIFDKPKELSEFNKYTDKKIEWYSGMPKVRVMRSLTKAPQNYCYIETEN